MKLLAYHRVPDLLWWKGEIPIPSWLYFVLYDPSTVGEGNSATACRHQWVGADGATGDCCSLQTGAI